MSDSVTWKDFLLFDFGKNFNYFSKIYITLLQNIIYRRRAIISRSWLQAALEYNLVIVLTNSVRIFKHVIFYFNMIISTKWNQE